MAVEARLGTAERIATRLGHSHVALEHWLLAAFEPPDELCCQVLNGARIDVVELRHVLEGVASTPGDGATGSAQVRAAELRSFLERVSGKSHAEALHAAFSTPRLADQLRAEAIDVELLCELLERHAAPPEDVDAPFLDQYCVDLTERARRGVLDPVFGREPELRQLVQILTQRLKNNPLIVGEPGVGKTALVEGLAHRMVAHQVPEHLSSSRLMSLDLGSMLAGTRFRGEFEARLKGVLSEVAASGRVILFIDEIHMLVGAGSAEGGSDAANLIKPALARGELRCIGATTPREYRQRIEKDGALSRRFQNLDVAEPTEEQALTMLRGLRASFASHHDIAISDDALQAAVAMSSRYLGDRHLPDKAIDLVDQACALLRSQYASSPEELELLRDRQLALEVEARIDGLSIERAEQTSRELERAKLELKRQTAAWLERRVQIRRASQTRKQLQQARGEMERLGRERRYAELATLQHRTLPALERELAELESSNRGGPSHPEVRAEDIARVVSRRTGIPASKLDESEAERLRNLEAILVERVVGQSPAVTRVARAIRRARTQLRDVGKPIASFLLVGPTGVGKTELSKAVAEFLCGDEHALLRFDMSEYQEKHTAARLIGAPPGYLGFDAGGELTNRVRRRPYSVLLFDEVEKAHPEVFNVLLQVLDEGRLTDAAGSLVDFKNTIIMLTSNLGGASAAAPSETNDEARLAAVKRFFRPEFLNRLDDVVVFGPLSVEDTVPIVARHLAKIRAMLERQQIGLEWDPEVLKTIAERAYDPENGARPVQRYVRDHIQDPIANRLLAAQLVAGQTVSVTGELEIECF